MVYNYLCLIALNFDVEYEYVYVYLIEKWLYMVNDWCFLDGIDPGTVDRIILGKDD